MLPMPFVIVTISIWFLSKSDGDEIAECGGGGGGVVFDDVVSGNAFLKTVAYVSIESQQ